MNCINDGCHAFKHCKWASSDLKRDRSPEYLWTHCIIKRRMCSRYVPKKEKDDGRY